MTWKRIFAEAGLMLAGALLLAAAANSIRSPAHRLDWIKRADPRPAAGAVAAPSAPGPGALYSEVSPDEAFRLHGNGALFLDARRTSAYEGGHIAGARSIPVWEGDADTRVGALAGGGIPFDREIVAYCSGPDCEDSARLAEKLALAGFLKLHVYKEGLPEWIRRGWPVTQGIAP